MVPLLGPTIRIWAFLSIIGALQLFDLVYIIWGQYISDTAGTSTMATYMVLNGRLAGNYGYGNAVAVVMFFISSPSSRCSTSASSCAVTCAAPSRRESADERGCERISKYSASANADSERQRGGLMSVAVPGAPFLRVRPAKRGDRPQKWGNPGNLLHRPAAYRGQPRALVAYIVLGGFRTNSQITVSPAGLPRTPRSPATTPAS